MIELDGDKLIIQDTIENLSDGIIKDLKKSEEKLKKEIRNLNKWNLFLTWVMRTGVVLFLGLSCFWLGNYLG